MQDVTNRNFGLLIAYVLPGFTALWGTSYFSPTVQSWVGDSSNSLTVGGFLYVTLASVAAGLTVSAVRWLTIDTLHHRTGIPQPTWDFTCLRDRVPAFDVMIEIHYRYYQFYANMIVALLLAWLSRFAAVGFSLAETLVSLGLAVIYLLGSRDTLRKYYRRVEGVLAA